MLKAQDQTFSTMKIENQNGKEEMANLQCDYLAKKNKTVYMKKYLFSTYFTHVL
jgi:hypothetical protein